MDKIVSVVSIITAGFVLWLCIDYGIASETILILGFGGIFGLGGYNAYKTRNRTKE